MAQRSSELVRLGQWLRELAREHNVAIVVANQVGDRFSTGGPHHSPWLGRASGDMPPNIMSAPLMNSSAAADSGSHISPPFAASTNDPMSLDHQQRWFTGWGDDSDPAPSTSKNLKTPSLGLIWTTQISCRIALIKRPVYGPGVVNEESERGEPVLRKWRRWMKVVFAPHVAPSGPGLERAVEFEIRGEGVRSVRGGVEDGGDGVDDEGLAR